MIINGTETCIPEIQGVWRCPAAEGILPDGRTGHAREGHGGLHLAWTVAEVCVKIPVNNPSESVRMFAEALEERRVI